MAVESKILAEANGCSGKVEKPEANGTSGKVEKQPAQAQDAGCTTDPTPTHDEGKTTVVAVESTAVKSDVMDEDGARTEISMSGLSPRGVGVANHLLKLLLTFRGGVTIVVCAEEALVENGARFKGLDGNHLKAVFEKYARSCHRYRCRQPFQVILEAFVTHKRSVKWEMWLLRRVVVGLDLKCLRKPPEVVVMVFTFSAMLFLYDVWAMFGVLMVVFVWLASIFLGFDWILPDGLVSALYEFPDDIAALRNRSKQGAVVIAENGNVVAAGVQIVHARNGSCNKPLENDGQATVHRKRVAEGLHLVDWMGRTGVCGATLVGSENGEVTVILPSATGSGSRCFKVVRS